jgi:hypothetical protein
MAFTEKNMEEKTDAAAQPAKKAAPPKSIATALDIFDGPNLVIEVDARELGPGKFIRVLRPSAEILDELMARDYPTPGAKRARGFLVRWAIACVVNEKNEPILSEDQVIALGKKSGALLERIFNAAAYGIGPTELDAAALEEIKN